MIQDTTFQQIRTRHVSEDRLEGPKELETDIPKVKTGANDMWAQNTTQPRKAEVGWGHRVVGRPARGPHQLKLAMWRKIIGCLHQFGEAQLQKTLPLAVAPIYKYRGGEEMKHTTQHNSTHLSPLEFEAFILDA